MGTITFKKDLGFSNADLVVKLNKPYLITRESESVYYMKDENGEEFGVSKSSFAEDIILSLN